MSKSVSGQMNAVVFGQPVTASGRAGLTALLDQPRDALIGLDFDGTLAPIVADPRDARAHPGAGPALKRLAGSIGTLAVITGRAPADAVAYGGLADVPGIIVLGHYGAQRWQDGQLIDARLTDAARLTGDAQLTGGDRLADAAQPAGSGSGAAVERARRAVPDLLRDLGAPEGTWIEDKQDAVAVHTRRTADPEAALELLRAPLTTLAAGLGLAAEPGRLVIELRPGGIDKGTALSGLVRDRGASSAVYCGDDLGDLPAFAAVRTLRGEGIPGCAVASASQETPEVAAQADMVVDGPAGVVALLTAIAAAL
jgi:trehalose 6-phosphate phosphatase